MPWTYEYDPETGLISGAVNNIVPLSQATKPGRALFRDNDDALKTNMMVDITQNPPVLIPYVSPPPPADMITHIFSALVQQGWIDPNTVDTEIIERANASLAVSGATTIAMTSKAALAG